jgi:ATP-dependent DNA helicase RecQ
LLGKSSERISQFGHDKISTFGIGKELSATEWRGLYRQLIAGGHLNVDVEGHGSVLLTELARPVLKGEEKLTLRRLTKEKPSKSKSASAIASSHSALWDALRKRRRDMAEEQGVPAYVIFHDATLAEMAERKPQTLQAMATISGVGKRKLEDYGQEFLDVILEHSDNRPPAQTASDTAAESILLLCQGLTPLEIAHRRGLTAPTIYRHLAAGITHGEIELADVVELSDEQLRAIQFAFEQSEDKRLKPVHETLGAAYDFGVLECVRAWLGSGQ